MATPDDPAFSYDDSPDLYLFTSLTAGSSHIITATSRLETILKANRVPFKAVDCATDEKARRIWSRRAQGKKLPGLVREGSVLGDLEAIEEWNEYGEIKQHLGGPPLPVRTPRFADASQNTAGGGNTAAQPLPTEDKDASASANQTLQNPQAGLLAAEAAKAAKARLSKSPAPARTRVETVAEAETDPTTLKNTELNTSPTALKKEASIESPSSPDKPKSPEAAFASLDSPPASLPHAIIAHGAMSAVAKRLSIGSETHNGGILKTSDTTAGEVKESAKQQDQGGAIKPEHVNGHTAKSEAEVAVGPAKSSGEAAVHKDAEAAPEAPTAVTKTEAGEKSEPKVSFAPDMTRELSEMGRSKRPVFEGEAVPATASAAATAAAAAAAGGPKDDGTAAAITNGDKTTKDEVEVPPAEKVAQAPAADADAAGDSVQD